MKRPALARAAAALLVPCALLLGAEGLLRLIGFSYRRSPIEIMIGVEDPLRLATEADPELFWRLRGNVTFDQFAVQFHINELGTRGPLPPLDRADDALRIVCAGDSTAFGNYTSYPGQLAAVLRERLPERRVEVINAGVPGYSAWQGLRFLERDLLRYKPHLVTWCFGFNNAKAHRDGLSDAERGGAESSFLLRMGRAALELRVGQAIKKAIDARRKHNLTFDPNRPYLNQRVSPLEQRRLLARAAERCRAAGATLVAVTQPHALRFDETTDDFTEWDLPSLREERRRLDAQNHATRVGAREADVPLLDLAARFEGRDPNALFLKPWPGPDSIHANPLGLRLIGEEIAVFLDEQGLLPAGARGPMPPRFAADASSVAAVAADRDGDGLDEVLLASAVEGRVRAAWLDPRSGTVEPVVLDLPEPTGTFDMVCLQRLRGETLFTVPDGKKGALAFTRRADGSAGIVAPMRVAVPEGGGLVVRAIDMAGDGRPEHLVGFGPSGPPRVLLLSDAFAPVATLAVPGDGRGPLFATGRILAPDREHALFAFAQGRPEVRVYGPDRKFQTWLTPAMGLRNLPTDVVVGRFHPNSSVDGVAALRFCAVALCNEHGAYGEPLFPLGALRLDRRAPAPAVARLPGAGAADRVLLGTRTADALHVAVLDGGTVQDVLTIRLDG